MAALPVYVARRRMMKMEPPQIYVPAPAVEGIQRLLRAWQRLDRGRMPCEIIGVEPGQDVDLSREHLVTVFETRHTLPSVGFVVWDRRRKLKPEYQGMPGEKIRDLRLAGEDVTQEVRIPLLCYMGDTAPEGLDGYPPVYEARILITEMTFAAPNHRKERIHKFGHLHLDDLVARASRFKNELIIAAHFTTRCDARQIRQHVERALPDGLQNRLMLWL
jgi:ribonuclease Z